MSSEIKKNAVRYRYPWKSLDTGEEFLIPSDNIPGVTNARQLCYAATRASKGEKEFKSYKNDDGSITIRRTV